MKIILLTDVRGKGKKGDVIDVADGYGNFLITQRKAVIADEKNLRKLEDERKEEARREAEHLKEMQALKQVLDQIVLKFKVKVGEQGQMFGSISTKQIATALENEHNIKIDRRKILLDRNIQELGVTRVKVQLHPEVIAEIQVVVSDK
ncbi:MAG TPA: 50S ribosomal protein L9 [Haloplasmataceae bacterium]